MKKTQPMLLVILTLTVATLACGTIGFGVEPKITEDESSNMTNVQGPNSGKADITDQANSSPDQNPEEQVNLMPTMAYIGLDHNIWVLDEGSDTPSQVTFDAIVGGEGETVEYMSPQLSSDGSLLAYSLVKSTPNTIGGNHTYGVWVLDLTTGKQSQILDGRSFGMAWKPGTHLLAYTTAAEVSYYFSVPNPAQATGIRGIDLDSGETLDLVLPERGYTLALPRWSPDGRFLEFSEEFAMEGSGLFAYYDLENQDYVAWDEPVGEVSWSPDGKLLAYARHTYGATGEERLYLRPLQGSERLFGPDYDGPAFATYPRISPTGNQLAYLAFLDGMETSLATMMLIDLAGGEPKPLGEFDSVWEFAWVPDGSQLVFSYGHWESPQIIALDVTNGSQTVLAAGSQPALAGQ